MIVIANGDRTWADTEVNDPVGEDSIFSNSIASERIVAEAIDYFLTQGIEAAMSKVN